MQASKSRSKIIFFIVAIAVIILAMYVTRIIFTKNQLTYNQVVSSKIESDKTAYDGKTIIWQGKVSNYYSQITGIKFCVIDQEHKNTDINKPCDWFWTSSDQIKDADNTAVNPSWNGDWVGYTLNYYKAGSYTNEERFYQIEGRVNGLDCAVDDKCVPDIEIINIK